MQGAAGAWLSRAADRPVAFRACRLVPEAAKKRLGEERAPDRRAQEKSDAGQTRSSSSGSVMLGLPVAVYRVWRAVSMSPARHQLRTDRANCSGGHDRTPPRYGADVERSTIRFHGDAE